MADFNEFKDMITGTIGNIVDKAKEVANSGAVKNAYEQGTAKAKSYGRIAKLTLELNGEGEELKRIYTEIGKLCYSQEKEAPSEIYQPLFAQAGELIARMDAKKEEIDSLSAQADSKAKGGEEGGQDAAAEDCAGADDFESVVSATEPEQTPEDGE